MGYVRIQQQQKRRIRNFTFAHEKSWVENNFSSLMDCENTVANKVSYYNVATVSFKYR